MANTKTVYFGTALTFGTQTRNRETSHAARSRQSAKRLASRLRTLRSFATVRSLSMSLLKIIPTTATQRSRIESRATASEKLRRHRLKSSNHSSILRGNLGSANGGNCLSCEDRRRGVTTTHYGKASSRNRLALLGHDGRANTVPS